MFVKSISVKVEPKRVMGELPLKLKDDKWR